MHDLGVTPSYADFLANLENSGFLADYHLTVYCRNHAAESPTCIPGQPCCNSAYSSLCGTVCVSQLPSILDQASENGRAIVFRCPVGLLGFVIKLRQESDTRHYLVGTGVREKSLDLYRIENVSKSEGINPFALLEHLQELPVAVEHKVKELAERVCSMAASIGVTEPARPESGNVERLKIVAAISASLDQAETPGEIFSTIEETVGMLFDVPAIGAAIPDAGGSNFTFQGGWGHSVQAVAVPANLLIRSFPRKAAVKTVLRDEMLKELFPKAPARFATCQSLVADEELMGVMFFFGMEFTPEDYLLVELLTGRASLRLARLRKEEESERKEAMSNRILSMIGSLASSEGQELHDLVLQMASELVNSSCGSLMILDEEQELLHIKSAIGMNPHMLKAMSIKVGSGIAGKVAASGHPLLVNDIEKDERVATPNRPRFKTKSFISMPLIFRGRVSGVLNLSDKKNNGIFTETDMEVLTPFVSHVASMIQRNCNLEKVELLERLSITDPLTELYNRRFLEKRMEEELNRSMRNGQNLTVMLIDLDYFKTYNDICGHVAGDKALMKAAKVLRVSVREMDVVTRYGGEEFCILLPGTSKRESIFVAERIRRDMENELFQGEEHLPFGRLTTSIGVSSFPEDGATATAVINSADIALYEAKSGGRNRIVIFNNSSHGEAGENFPKITLMKK